MSFLGLSSTRKSDCFAFLAFDLRCIAVCTQITVSIEFAIENLYCLHRRYFPTCLMDVLGDACCSVIDSILSQIDRLHVRTMRILQFWVCSSTDSWSLVSVGN